MLPLMVALAAGLPAAPAMPTVKQPAPILATQSGLRIQTLVAGTGGQPQATDSVLVTYEGRLADGTVFDSAQSPVALPVSGLVPGFTEALLLMKKGGRYRIWIPANLAYGEAGAGSVIPPNAELDFTIALLDIAPAAPDAQPQ